jgi:membrane associated rhomboid family serine protease
MEAPPPPPPGRDTDDASRGSLPAPGPHGERPALAEMVGMKETLRNAAVRGYMNTVCSFLGAKSATQEDAEERRRLELARKFANRWMHKTFVHRKGARLRKIAEMNYDKRWRSRAFFKLKSKARKLRKATAAAKSAGVEMADQQGAHPQEQQPVSADAVAISIKQRPQPPGAPAPAPVPAPVPATAAASSSSSSSQSITATPAARSDREPLAPKAKSYVAADLEFEDWEEDDPDDLAYTPWFVWTMTVLHVAVFVLEVWNNNWSLESFSANPFFGVSDVTLEDFGAKTRDGIVDRGEGWRLFSAVFPHSGVIHLVLSVAMQLRLGLSLERLYGWWRLAFIYFLSSVTGYMGSCLFLPDDLGVGATPAHFGLFGCLIVEIIQNWKRMENPVSSLMEVLLTILCAVVVGLLPNLDNYAQLVGLAAGIPLAGIFLPTVMFDAEKFDVKRKLAVIAVCLVPLVAFYVLAVPLVYAKKDLNSVCSFCKYLNCVPIKDKWCDAPSI